MTRFATHEVFRPSSGHHAILKNRAVDNQRTGIMEKQVKSAERWREEINQDATGGRGRFKILSRSLFNSLAFANLGGSGTIVVLSILNKLEYKKRDEKDKKGVRVGQALLRNQGDFVLTINELVARGLSRSTATRARVLAWEMGFFDVLEPGTIHHAGRYRYSERWKKYPHGDYNPVGQQPPGKNVYPESGFQQNVDPKLGESADISKTIFPAYLKVVGS